jgi:TetR/AcrR family transcriptional regulator
MNETGDTRERIFIIALKLFSRRGYDSSGVQEIADEAGITKPTLYYYFGNKRGLLDAIVSRYGDILIASTRKAAEYHHNPVINLTELFQNTLDFARNNEDFFRLIMTLFSAAPETPAYAAGAELRRQLVAIIELFFIEASGDHGNMKNRQKVYAETFMGLLETWAILTVNGEMRMTPQLQYRIIHQYMHGIFS